MSKPRRFITRNGSIIQESERDGTCRRHGFIDDYIIIKNESKKSFKSTGNYICLLLQEPKGNPTGGQHGEGWDIIKEVKKQWWRFWK